MCRILLIPMTGVLAALLAPSSPAMAGDECATDEVTLNTGFDHFNGGILPIGDIDPRWSVIADPQANTSEPRPATVILKNPAWEDPEPGSQWISGYPGSAQTTNGAYIFETVFCVQEGIDLSTAALVLAMRADDACFAYLNTDAADIVNNTATPFYQGQTFNDPNLVEAGFSLESIGAVIGKNTLQIEVQNISSVAMGLNLVATVVASPSGTAVEPECCCPFGAIQGIKFHDLDGDGVRDPGEPGLPGWEINLVGNNNPAVSVMTDDFGFFNFTNVPPDTYTLTETPQTGWQQTFPPTGSHTVTLAGIQGITGLEFGNTEASCEISNEDILCDFDDPSKVTYTFDITNNSGVDAEEVWFTPQTPSNMVFMDNMQDISVPDGSTATVSVMIIDPAGGDLNDMEICFTITLIDENLEQCCSVTVCITPDCDCFQIVPDSVSIECVDGDLNKYTYTFQFQNLTDSDIIEHLYFSPPDGVVFDHAGTANDNHVEFVPPLNPVGPGGISAPITVEICYDPLVIPTPMPGDKLTLVISVHDEFLDECCAREICIIIPECDGGGELMGACCPCDGSPCFMTTADDCLMMNGTYQGDGTNCTDDPCFVLFGGCCLPTGECEIVTPCECAFLGGTPQPTLCEGDDPCGLPDCCGCEPSGVPGCPNNPDCEAIVCTDDPFCCDVTWDQLCCDSAEVLCPPAEECGPLGACCLPGGDCELDYTQTGCDNAGGTYFGDGSTSCPPLQCQASLLGDCNNDGFVNGADLGLLLGAWATADVNADLNGDGTVDGSDLGLLLGNWSGDGS